jgi:hypothetical protein
MILYAQWAGIYYVTRDVDNVFVGAYYWLSDAVAAIPSRGGHTITLTGQDDDDLTNTFNIPGVPPPASSLPVVAIAGRVITLTSDTGSRSITQRDMARHLSIAATVTLEGIVLKGLGFSSGTSINGGVDIISGSFTINEGTVIESCYSGNASNTGQGGGVAYYAGSMVINGGMITNNVAQQNGGGVYAINSFTMNGGTISNNIAQQNGGGVYTNAAFTMNGGTITQNRAVAGNGGGIYSWDHDYSDPANVYSWWGITVNPAAEVSGNMASVRVVPPSNAADFNNASYRPSNPFDGKLLDNYNIDYRRNFEEMSAAALSKIITGEYADKTRRFEFTIKITDASGNPLVGDAFLYDGGVVAGSGATPPPNGYFILNAQSKATISLGQGQMITILDLLPTYKVQIIETVDASQYITSFIDSNDPSGTPIISNDTTLLPVGSTPLVPRAFDFTNERNTPVPAGIMHANSENTFVYLAVLLIAGLLAIKLLTTKRKQRRV